MSYLATIKKKYFRKTFDAQCRDILLTAPIELDERSGVAVLSQTYHPDLMMYLVAAKSFAQYIRPALFVIVDDGLLPEDRTVIRQHLRRVEFVDRRGVPNTVCPAGGTWERLLSVADFCERHDVVQLDSDTVTVAHPTDVAERLRHREAFTLPTQQGNRFVSVGEASETVRQSDSAHVQVQAEKKLGEIDALRHTCYIRGCSGFAGFPKGSVHRTDVERFSALMEQHLGRDLWSSWGSEQFTSNYLIANTPKKATLPFEHYPYWKPGMDVRSAQLIHFIGDDRFTSGAYAQTARQAIQAMPTQ
ncbi:MAG: hypothetical protein KGZ67_07790 [Hydrogenophaga sp.]|jgi:hypothetical protein|nr:hypothetical protein [Hydrogenophaga sp.]